MNGKRTASESTEILTKKARLIDGLSADGINSIDSEESTPQCEAEPQTHGEPTFAAITDDNGMTGQDYDDLGIEFLDDFKCTADQDRQPVAGKVSLSN